MNPRGSRNSWWSLALGLGAAAGLRGPALAADPSPGAGSGQPAGAEAAAPDSGEQPPAPVRAALEELIVTSRRRPEPVRRAPLSVAAFSAADLRSLSLSRLDEIGQQIPNVSFGHSAGSANSARILIRGIGTGDPIASRDPGAGFYVDGVYLARAQGPLIGLGDLERIEVLRGPQGTLFGRNTIGGAIRVFTRPPGPDFEATGMVRLGNHHRLESQASVNLPLAGEKAAARLSLQSTRHDGYSRNRLNGQDADDRRLLGGRLALLLRPTPELELVLGADRSRTHSSGRGAECRLVPSALPGGGLLALGDQLGRDYSGACRESQRLDALEFHSPLRSKDNLDVSGATAIARWQLGSTSLASISAWRRQRIATREDLGFSRAGLFELWNPREEQRQLSQEISRPALWLRVRFHRDAAATPS